MTNQRYRMVCLLNALESRLQSLRAERSLSEQAIGQVFAAESRSILLAATPQDMRYVRDRLDYMIEELQLSTPRQSLAA